MLAALAILRTGPAQGAFALTGAVLEAAGLVLLFRAHRIVREDPR